jgi:hypothetical protein
MNRDFVEMLAALCAAGAEFLLVGAHALAAHGVPRATGDLDLWIRPTPQNAARVWQALVAFGAPLAGLKPEDLHSPDLVYQIGLPPCRIDLLTSISGMEFDEAWADRLEIPIQSLTISCLSREAFVRNKRAAGRPRDLADIALLEAEGDRKE